MGSWSAVKLILDVFCNLILPSWILTQYSGEENLGRVVALCLALSFPIVYGAINLVRAHRKNILSIIGVISVSLTASFALLEFRGVVFAIKEAMIPAVIGLLLLSLGNRDEEFLREVFLNPFLVKKDLVNETAWNKTQKKFLLDYLAHCNRMLAVIFFISSVMNFFLARMILKSPTATSQFNYELGLFSALSYPLILVPCLVLGFLGANILIRRLESRVGRRFRRI